MSSSISVRSADMENSNCPAKKKRRLTLRPCVKVDSSKLIGLQGFNFLSLPEDIVSRIIAEITLKEAVRMGAVCRKLRGAWIYHPNLDFDISMVQRSQQQRASIVLRPSAGMLPCVLQVQSEETLGMSPDEEPDARRGEALPDEGGVLAPPDGADGRLVNRPNTQRPSAAIEQGSPDVPAISEHDVTEDELKLGKLSLSGGSEARDEVAPDAVLHSRANRDALTLAVGEEGRELVGQDSVPMPAVSPEIGRGPVADGNAGDEPERRQKLAEAVPMATLDLALQGEQVHPAVCPGGKAGVVQAMQKLEEQTCVVHAELTHAEAALVLGISTMLGS